MNDPQSKTSVAQPTTCLPPWGEAELPKPARRVGWRHWTGFIGPGIVMCGIQTGGGEWLFGPAITAKYGGGLMWIATIAIICQVFYNLECGRYALYCGEPVFTGFMRARPGPRFWISVFVLLNFGAFIPGLSTHGAAVLAAGVLNRPPGEEDRLLVSVLAYVLLGAVSLPILVGGKIYNTIQAIMTAKVAVVLGFCFLMGVLFVSPANWWNVLSGFFKIGNVPVDDGAGGETVVNAFSFFLSEGHWPVIALGNIAVLGAFAGYAGGGGLSNSTYSNFVRDKGWGMGAQVGAIPSAIGGRQVTLSHLGKVFPINAENLRRWKLWWKHILTDQLLVWGPGCFMGMALPALISIQFAPHSPMYGDESSMDWALAIISADGIRHAPQLSSTLAATLWFITLFVGLMVLLPSQMSIVDDVCRRWTDIIWSGSRRVRETMKASQVKYIYYSILACYMIWTFLCAWYFTSRQQPKLMVLIIANLNNVALGFTAFFILRNNCRLIPEPLRPGWISRLGVIACGVFYLGLAVLVFVQKQLPMLREMLP